MTRRLLNFDPLTKLSTWHEYDAQTDITTIIIDGDSQPFIEQNKARANDKDYSRKGIKGEFWHYASIPPAVQVKWLIEEGIDVYKKSDLQRVSKKLEDPAWKHLKTTTKHHHFHDR